VDIKIKTGHTILGFRKEAKQEIGYNHLNESDSIRVFVKYCLLCRTTSETGNKCRYVFENATRT
jgi:hypothetical protein